LTTVNLFSLLGEAYQVFGGAPIDCVLSIGTGIPASMELSRGPEAIKYFVSVSTNTQTAHEQVKRFVTGLHPNGITKYWRLNMSKQLNEGDTIEKLAEKSLGFHLMKDSKLDYATVFGALDNYTMMKFMVELTSNWLERQPQRIQAFIDRKPYPDDN
jgi:hypothetical protein